MLKIDIYQRLIIIVIIIDNYVYVCVGLTRSLWNTYIASAGQSITKARNFKPLHTFHENKTCLFMLALWLVTKFCCSLMFRDKNQTSFPCFLLVHRNIIMFRPSGS
jgi:hypothetical protein